MRFVEANGIRYAYLNELTGQAVEKLHVSMHVEASGIELSVVSASSTSRWEFIQAVAAALAAPVAMFAQSNAPVARAWVRTELVQLEKAGYQPGFGDNTTYPAQIQAAEAKVAAQNDATGVGAVANGSSDTGRPAVSKADWNAMYNHP
jgi:hypothetical protein